MCCRPSNPGPCAPRALQLAAAHPAVRHSVSLCSFPPCTLLKVLRRPASAEGAPTAEPATTPTTAPTAEEAQEDPALATAAGTRAPIQRGPIRRSHTLKPYEAYEQQVTLQGADGAQAGEEVKAHVYDVLHVKVVPEFL